MKRSLDGSIEIQTLLLIIFTYIIWLLALYFWNDVLVFKILLPLIIVFQNSLQHEIIHGHPFKGRLRKYNDLLGIISLNPFSPYFSYKRNHLKHHRSKELTNPKTDPESYYSGRNSSFFSIYFTLLGRMILGPFITTYKSIDLFIRNDVFNKKLIFENLIHLFSLFVVLFTLVKFNFSIGDYVAFGVYPAISIGLIRSFMEHRPRKKEVSQNRHQSIIVDDNGINGKFFSFLFLNNNFHIVHHQRPNLPWFKIPKEFKSNPNYWKNLNGYFYYKNYLSVSTHYLTRCPTDLDVK